MYDALNTAVSLAVSQSVMMTVLIFLSTAQRADNDPPEGGGGGAFIFTYQLRSYD